MFSTTWISSLLFTVSPHSGGLSWFIMRLSTEKARLYIFKHPSPQASVAFIDDILMAFEESVNSCSFTVGQMASKANKAWI